MHTGGKANVKILSGHIWDEKDFMFPSSVLPISYGIMECCLDDSRKDSFACGGSEEDKQIRR